MQAEGTGMVADEWFYVVPARAGVWVVRHQVTGELAATIERRPGSYVLLVDGSRTADRFDSIDQALAGLYELA